MRRFGDLKDAQRRAMFARMNGSNRFSKDDVSQPSSFKVEGNTESILESPIKQAKKIEYGMGGAEGPTFVETVVETKKYPKEELTFITKTPEIIIGDAEEVREPVIKEEIVSTPLQETVALVPIGETGLIPFDAEQEVHEAPKRGFWQRAKEWGRGAEEGAKEWVGEHDPLKKGTEWVKAKQQAAEGATNTLLQRKQLLQFMMAQEYKNMLQASQRLSQDGSRVKFTDKDGVERTKVIELPPKEKSELTKQIGTHMRNIHDFEGEIEKTNLQIDRSSFLGSGLVRRGFGEGLAVEEQKLGQEIGRDVIRTPIAAGERAIELGKEAVMFPGKAIARTGRAAKGVVETWGPPLAYDLAKGAEAFGTTAGVGITKGLAEIGDIMDLPKREFWTPPGYQPVWTGSSFETQRVPRYVMEPWAYSSSMGTGMPPGVQPTVAEIPTPIQARRLWGPTAVVQPDRGYGGADVEYDTRKMGGGESYKPMVDVPRIQMPNFFLVDPTIPKWIIPPADMGSGKPVARSAVPMQRAGVGVPRMGMGVTVASPEQRARSVQMLESAPSSPLKMYKPLPVKPVAKSIFAGYSTTKEGMLKPKSYISRSLGRVLSDKSRLDSLRSVGGVDAPEVRKLEAKVQSEADYVSRHVSPGSYGEVVLKESGLYPGGS